MKCLARNLWILGVVVGSFIVASGSRPMVANVGFGLFRQDAPAAMSRIRNFETTYGMKPAVIMWYQDWRQKFPLADCKKVADYGAIPHIVWEPWVWGDPDAISLEDIIKGKHDAYIKSWANGIKAYGKPIFIRYAHEFNIDGYPWGTVHHDRNTTAYIAAWKHVVDLFRKEGAVNALWVWCPMNVSWPDSRWNDYLRAYPGDNYVDWIGIDGYNWGKSQSWSEWLTFEQVFRESVRNLSKNFPTKPIMIAEFASDESGGDKGEWIRDIGIYLQTTLRQIKLIQWFDLKKETDWRIASSPTASAGFSELLRSGVLSGVSMDVSTITVNYVNDVPRVDRSLMLRGNPVVIDGDLSEWPADQFVAVEGIANLSDGAPRWRGAADLSGRSQLASDGKNLYVAVAVTDDIPMNNSHSKGDIWNGDAVEICIGLADNPTRSSFQVGDFQIGLSPGNSKDILPLIWNWGTKSGISGSKIAAKRTATGYVIEASIPWQSLGYSPVPDIFKFSMALDDADVTENREKQLVESGDFLFYKDPSVWGTLRLIGKP